MKKIFFILFIIFSITSSLYAASSSSNTKTTTSNYDKGIYVDLTSLGSGTHSFNYQPITVSLVGKVGISSIGSETFQASIQPIFRGGCTSVHLENKGVGYGSSEIINYIRDPLVTLSFGLYKNPGLI